MAQKITFGDWLKRRRKMLDLTQQQLAGRAHCSVATIYKIEAGRRRPSSQIAELLGAALGIPESEREAFIQFARSTHGTPLLDRRTENAPWRAAFIPDNNLPMQLDTLLGREALVTDAHQRLQQDEVRLLTLLGPPGIGKTRLAIQLGEEALLNFPDGVFFVELASITNPDQVVPAIAHILDILLTGRKDPLEDLKQYLYERRMLLILDNLEQLLDAAPVVSAILATCPLVKIVITSRAPLRVRGERQFPIEPLALPGRSSDLRLDSLGGYAAIQLFVERAQAVHPAFELTADNAATVTAICARLDGLPLAIEIVSARVKILQPADILDRLTGRLLLKSEGRADAEPRHRTLSAAVGWSVDHLDDDEQRFFQRLGVFVDGCTLDAARTVAQPATDALDVMSSLVDMNLVKRDSTDCDHPRFTLLETIREYALHELRVNDKLTTLAQRHAAYFYDMVLKLEPGLHTGGQVSVLACLAADHGNLLAALDHFVSTNDWQKALGLAGALGEFWVYRNHLVIGLRYAEKLLAATIDAEAMQGKRAKLSNRASMLAYFAGDFPAVARHAEQALALATEADSQENMAFACLALGMGLGGAGEYEQAASMLAQGLVAARKADEQWLIASIRNGFGELARSQGAYDQAQAQFEEALEIATDIAYTWLASHILDNIGLTAYSQGYYDRARDFFQRSLTASIDLGDQRGMAMVIEKIGGLYAVEGQAEIGARLLGAADALRTRKNAPIEGMDMADYQQFVQFTHDQLDQASFDAEWQAGQQLPLSQVMALIFGDPTEIRDEAMAN
ncbi:MAG: helix-turn-helix domain-containing protein [Chloroflexi bacterium]|nr:helix-turn-helix domain-containing protein [Chloroflexota bacterium]